ncbi:hypothetical protein [Bradyrhizobium sp. USDA 4452]
MLLGADHGLLGNWFAELPRLAALLDALLQLATAAIGDVLLAVHLVLVSAKRLALADAHATGSISWQP